MTTSIKKQAVVFGGAGFIGKYLVRALANENWKVAVVTRRPERNRDLLVLPTVKLVTVDINSPAEISSLMEHHDTIINLVGILNETRKSRFENIHVQFPHRLVETCIQNNVRRFIHVSSLGANINAPSAYLRSKGQAEEIIMDAQRQGLDCAILRPSIVFGPDDSFTTMFNTLLKLAVGVFLVISPDSQMQPVYVRDLVKCLLHTVTEPELTIRKCDIAGPEVYFLIELIAEIDRLAGRRHRLIPLTDSLSKLLAMFAQFLPEKPLSPDNVLSLQVPNILRADSPQPYGAQPTRFEDAARMWLHPKKSRLDNFRTQRRL